MTIHAAVIHVENSLGIIDFIPFGESSLFTFIGFQLDQLLLFFLVSLFVLPHMPGLWRLQDAMNSAIHMATEMPGMINKTKLPAVRLVRVQLDPVDQTQAIGLNVLTHMPISKTLERGGIKLLWCGPAEAVPQLS